MQPIVRFAKKILPKSIYEVLKQYGIRLIYPFVPKSFLYTLTSYRITEKYAPLVNNLDVQEEIARQIHLNYDDIMNKKEISRPSEYLLSMIPKNCISILEIGCGIGRGTYQISRSLPKACIAGVDVSSVFIKKAESLFSTPNISFVQGDMHTMQFQSASFDCVVADNVLEHSYDIKKLLLEIKRVLCPGGFLVAAIPSDGRNRAYNNSAHLWKTTPKEVRYILKESGFRDMLIEEINTVMKFSTLLYPPSNDMMMYVTARNIVSV